MQIHLQHEEVDSPPGEEVYGLEAHFSAPYSIRKGEEFMEHETLLREQLEEKTVPQQMKEGPTLEVEGDCKNITYRSRKIRYSEPLLVTNPFQDLRS